jgi:hypothetical protein
MIEKYVALAEKFGAEVGRHEGEMVWMKSHSQSSVEAFATGIVMLAALRQPAPTPAEPAKTEAALTRTLRERDNYCQWADKLAHAIAKYFGVDIGEHSNRNNPWREALDAVPEATPPTPEAEPAQQDTKGWRLVPVEPTEEMEAAAEDDYEANGETFPDWKSKWRAMIAAAPQSPSVQQAAATEPMREALKELLETSMAQCPSFEEGVEAQNAWTDRRIQARINARAALAATPKEPTP